MNFSNYKYDKMCQSSNQIYETVGIELNARMQAISVIKWSVMLIIFFNDK